MKITLSPDQFTALTLVATKETPAPKGYAWCLRGGGYSSTIRLVNVKRAEQESSGEWNAAIEVCDHQTLCVPGGNPEQSFPVIVPRGNFEDLFEALGVFPEGLNIKV